MLSSPGDLGSELKCRGLSHLESYRLIIALTFFCGSNPPCRTSCHDKGNQSSCDLLPDTRLRARHSQN